MAKGKIWFVSWMKSATLCPLQFSHLIINQSLSFPQSLPLLPDPVYYQRTPVICSRHGLLIYQRRYLLNCGHIAGEWPWQNPPLACKLTVRSLMLMLSAQSRRSWTWDNFRKIVKEIGQLSVKIHPFPSTFQQKTKKSVGKIFFYWGLTFFDDFGQKWQESNFHRFDHLTSNVRCFLTISSRRLGPPPGERAKKIISETPPTFENRVNKTRDMMWQSVQSWF